MMRKGLFAAACALIVALASASPAMAESAPAGGAAGTDGQVTTKHASKKGTIPLGDVTSLDSQNSDSLRRADNPPGGGCGAGWGWDYIAYYTNSVLTSVTIAFNSQVVCVATGPGQSMGALVTTAGLWKGTTQVDEALPESCVNCLVTPVSGTVYVCDAGVSCAGGYWVSNLHVLGAPAGWLWGSAPAGCIGLGSPPYTLIECATVSDIFTISPTY